MRATTKNTHERIVVQEDIDVSEGADLVTGIVKWFDPTKGFGFVVADNSKSDILLHVNVLRNYGQSSIADGSLVDIRVQQTDRGIQAVEVVHIEPPAADASHAMTSIAELDEMDGAQGPLRPGRVKWFDKGKGFGFANVFGRRDDIFLHMEVLRRSGLSDLSPGEALALRVIEGKRGHMAAQVFAWEAALEPDA